MGSDLVRAADAALERATVIAHTVWDAMNDAHQQIVHDGGRSTWPAGFCTDASVLFWEDCDRAGVGCVYVWGRFGWIAAGRDGFEDASAPHAWNELDDGTLVDLTATQFWVDLNLHRDWQPEWNQTAHGPLIIPPDDRLQRLWWPEAKGTPDQVARQNVRRP